MDSTAPPITNTAVYVALLHVGLKRYAKKLGHILMEAIRDECPANLLIAGTHEVVALELHVLMNLFNQKHLLESNVNPDAIKVCRALYDEVKEVTEAFLNKLVEDAGQGSWTEEPETSAEQSVTFAEQYKAHIRDLFGCIKNIKTELEKLEATYLGLKELTLNENWSPHAVIPPKPLMVTQASR
jgi:hypothetical protein